MKTDEILFILASLQDSASNCRLRSNSDGCKITKENLTSLVPFLAPHFEDPLEAAWLKSFRVNLAATITLLDAEATLRGWGGNVGIREITLDSIRSSIQALINSVLYVVAQRLPELTQTVLPRRTLIEGPISTIRRDDD